MKPILTFFCLLSGQILMAQIPELTLLENEKDKPLILSQLSIDMEVVGNIATTTFDMTFQNQNTRDLEGELSMPLGDGKEISRYALDINGKLREGVVVEKVKARQAFEAVVRQNIDPGIVNKTKGNFFKTRIYPIPAQGTKRVVIGFVETLNAVGDNLHYNLPAGSKQTIRNFELNVQVIKGHANNVSPVSEFQNLVFDSQKNTYNLSFRRKDYTFSEPLKFSIPRFAKSDYQLFTENLDGVTYFYLNAKAPVLNKTTKPISKNIAIYWDCSASGSQRNLEKEMEFLTQYLQSIPGTKKVTLIGFGLVQEEPKSVKVGNDIAALINHIRNYEYDGATKIYQVHFEKKYDEILLFTDGVNTIGKAEFKKAKAPIHAIVSSFGANYNLLKQTCAMTDGVFIDLNKRAINDALNELTAVEAKMISTTFASNDFEEIYPNIPVRIDDFVEVFGILKSDNAKITLNYGSQGKTSQSQSYIVTQGKDASISRLWASQKIASLEWDYDNNQQEILDLGRHFNIVTRNSSLLVLDRVEDYVTHEIAPPTELKKAFDSLMALKPVEESVPIEVIREQNLERFNRLKIWYDSPPEISNAKKVSEQRDEWSIEETEEGFGDEEEMEFDAVVSEEEVIEDIVFSETAEEEMAFGMAADDFSADEDVEELLNSRVAGMRVTQGVPKAKAATNKPSIKVLAWLPDAPYMDELRNTTNEDLAEVYFKLKEENKNRPSFYIQVADLFFERGLNEMAIQILSNTIELDLENPELLKVVGRRLLDEGAYALAVEIYKEIRDLRPEEPQSFRDLALAYLANEQFQEAVEMYAFILEQRWDRFEEIKDVVFNELNGIVSRYEHHIDFKKINKDYIKSMPYDVRVTIDWSSNDNDIDLWVVDPMGEKCFYSNPHTTLGGRISKDFTSGYGPEEYTLKTAERGTYTVYVNYFSESRQTITGPVTVYATFFTGYGTKNQESERIAIQLSDNKETKQIGQLEF